MLILATIPVGVSGLALEHLFRTVLGKPVPAAIFLTVNGLILFGGERLRRRDPATATARPGVSRAPARAGRHAATAAMDGAGRPAARRASAPAEPACRPHPASDRRRAR